MHDLAHLGPPIFFGKTHDFEIRAEALQRVA